MSQCEACRERRTRGAFDFSMAFQPIVDLTSGSVFAYEALCRGSAGEGAGEVLSRISDENRYWFDQACRSKSIQLASRLGMECNLSINFLPNAIYRPSTCIRATIEAAEKFGFPLERIIFEFTESERLDDPEHLLDIVRTYQQLGFRTAIDDFGAGYAGLGMLSEFQPDLIKLDMRLIRGIHQDSVRQSILRGMLGVAFDLGCQVIAEGVEEEQELAYLRDSGISLFQGFLLARPAFEALPTVALPAGNRP